MTVTGEPQLAWKTPSKGWLTIKEGTYLVVSAVRCPRALPSMLLRNHSMTILYLLLANTGVINKKLRNRAPVAISGDAADTHQST
jgi:hypothetical protein